MSILIGGKSMAVGGLKSNHATDIQRFARKSPFLFGKMSVHLDKYFTFVG